MANATNAQGDVDAQAHTPAALLQCGVESLIHNYTQYSAMLRGEMAKKMGLDPDKFATPFPGHSNVKITNGLRSPGIALIVLLVIAALGMGAYIPIFFAARRAIERSEAPAFEGPNGGISFDPNEYEFRIVPTEGE
jgi:hypothetical protein